MKKVAGIYVNPEDVSAIDFRVTEGSDGNDYAHPVLPTIVTGKQKCSSWVLFAQ